MELISENQIKALQIVKDNPKVKASDFAKLMWPDSPMHNAHYKKINRFGLSYLFKLVKRNWVTEHNYKFELTKEGLNLINNKQTNE